MRSDRFERLYAEHAQALFGFLAYRTGDRVLAEDLLSETFERALRAGGRYDPRQASEKTWIYSIALNLLRDNARRASAERRALQRVDEPHSTAASPLDRVDDREALRCAMAALSDDEREAIALRYGADLTVPETARALDERLTTVEGRVYRALRKLREHMDSHP